MPNTQNVSDAVTNTANIASQTATDTTNSLLTGTHDIINNVMSNPIVESFSQAAPKILMGILLLIAGLIIAGILESLTRKFLNFIKTDESLEKIGLADSLRKIGLDFSFSNLIAKFVKYGVIILTLIATADTANLDSVSKILNDLLNLIPQLFIVLVILGAGFVGGDFVKKLAINSTRATNLSDKDGYLIGSVAKSIIIVLSIFMALTQLDIAKEMLNVVMGGFMLAFGLAFGLGSKKAVERFWDNFSKNSDQ